ncbi:pilus assembly protein [uncultured Mobiluncus sp.]|uniref:TadE family protein n=1 Tax=uncultured Mobiluncus sp. TaxID=293425 RepID=UPI0028054A9E|nr:pilus assembly protein [uncultured Mobiluncus sp.]
MMMNVGKGWRQQLSRRLVRRWLAHGRRLSSENGMVTTELALTFPAVIMIVVALALTGAAGMAGVQVNAAARAACRSVAIGEDSAAAVAAGNRLLGGAGGSAGAVSVNTTGKDVQCSATKKMPAMLGMLGMSAKAQAVIPREDSW